MEFLFKEWQETWVPELKERRVLATVMPRRIRKVITFTGIRRAGKTYLMYQLIKELSRTNPKESIFYIDFEDERIEKTTENLTKLVPILMKLYGNGNKRYFLFLDEVQIMPEWSRWLRRIYDTYRNIELFVSGSSSKLSSKEIPTELRGRALNYEIFPLDFQEFLRFRNIDAGDLEYSERKTSQIKRALSEYAEYGGFPEAVLENSPINTKRIVQDYFRTIISRDICERHNVKKINLLTDFLRLLLNSTHFSANKSVNILKSQGKKAGKETIMNYAHYAEEAFFCFFVPIFSHKIKNQEQYPKKVYFADNAFITNLSVKFSKNYGRLYENLVFLKLKREQIRNPLVDIYYWKSPQEEVDFVVKRGQAVEELIQVCYDIDDIETKKREIRALVKASKELKCRNLLIVTNDLDAEEQVTWFGTKRKIKYVPLWKWLLTVD